MNSPHITVLIPTYKHKNDIEKAVESVLRQTIIKDCHIIISDDCSPDDTYAHILYLFGENENITVRQNVTNLGIMPHYITLSKLVKTEYVAILEGDDHWIDNEKLSKQLDLMSAHPHVDFCFCGSRILDEMNEAVYRHPKLSFNRYQYIHINDILNDNHMATFSSCFTRPMLLEKV